MSGETLYTIACEMLNKTNVFNTDVSDIKYTNSIREEISLFSCLKEETSKYGSRFCQRSERTLQLAYKCIIGAMSAYLESYPAGFYFKQCVRKNFYNWVNDIKSLYSIVDKSSSDVLKIPKNEKDTGVAMLKLLHAREGITREGLENELGVTDRAVQKALVKISPSLYNGPGEAYTPFRLGGQPLNAEITLVDDVHSSKKRFYTLNTVHPIVLQENITQLATLLQALSRQFWKNEDDVTRLIGIDIWSQMSDYARNKIIDFFAFDDEDLEGFVDIIKNECPDEHACMYCTERDMLSELDIELPTNKKLQYLMKSEGRKGVIILNSGERITSIQITPQNLVDGNKAYRITNENGKIFIITKEQIKDIII